MDLTRLGQLHRAANSSVQKEQKVELLKKVNIQYSISNDIYKNLQEKSGYTCLHIAAIKLDSDCVCELVDRGADVVKQGTRNGKTPIHVVLDAKAKIRDISGKLQHCQVVDTLLHAHVKSENPFNPKCKNGMSHLHIACMFDHADAVRFFLNNGEAINQVTHADSFWPLYNPLHFAMRYSSVETAEILLRNGADLFAKDAEGISPFQILLKRLLDVADYFNMGERTISVPYEDELNRIEKIASIIIKINNENGVSFLDDTGLTTFHIASAMRDSLVLESFLDDILDLNVVVKDDSKFWAGWTPLHFAACSNPKTVKILMQRGADVTTKNKKGETPLDMCFKRFAPATVHSILSTKDKFKSILLSDSDTTLMDLILAMNNMKSLYNFSEQQTQPDISVSAASPLFQGYSLLHLALSMNSKTKSWDDFVKETDSKPNVDSLTQVYNCTDDESRLSLKRVRTCLFMGCSVDLNDSNGLTPIHLAFKNHDVTSDILNEMLDYCKENVPDPSNLSHLHIACALGNQKAVQILLNTGSNVNDVVTKSFQWYEGCYYYNRNKPRLISVNANSTPLHVAVTFKHSSIIKILLEKGANPYVIDSKGFTPIHLSLFNYNYINVVSKVKELIEMVTKEGLSHLHVAAFAGDAAAIKKLVDNGSDVNRSIDSEVPACLSRFAGKTPLQIATQVSRGNVAQAVRVLIESGADIYANDTLQCLMGETDVDYSQYFIDQLKLNENVNEPLDSSGLTLLHVACSQFDVDWATKLLEKGADVNARIRNDEDYKGRLKGYTPLHSLVYRRYRIGGLEPYNDSSVSAAAKLATLMLNRGADATIDSEGGTAMHLSYSDELRRNHASQEERPLGPPLWTGTYRNGLPDYIPRKLLLVKSYQNPGYKEAQTRLWHETRPELPQWELRENPDCTNWVTGRPGTEAWRVAFASMLHSRTSVNPISPDGFSHFHFFCMTNSHAVVRQYLDNGVDVNHSTNPFATNGYAGYAPLHFAIGYDAVEVAKLLIERGADVTVENADGNTPLHLLRWRESSDPQGIAILLKTHGANFNAKNIRGETPADFSMTRKNFPLEQLQFFLENGSSINVKKSSSVPGPAALIIRNALIGERLDMFKLFIKFWDANGYYDPIQDIVKAKCKDTDNDYLLYLHIILEFINAGYAIDQEDENGCTALHNSIVRDNLDAMYAMIQVGADINACDLSEKILDPSDYENISSLSMLAFVAMLAMREHLALQVLKMDMLVLHVNPTNKSILDPFKNDVAIEGNVKINIDMELERAESIKLTENLSAKAFLSELWAVVHYSRLSQVDRRAIDAFFKDVDYLLEHFPFLCSLLLVQYKKAVVRPKLIEIVKEVLTSECEIYLPDCLDFVLNYVSNDELKYMINYSEEAENLSKGLRMN